MCSLKCYCQTWIEYGITIEFMFNLTYCLFQNDSAPNGDGNHYEGGDGLTLKGFMVQSQPLTDTNNHQQKAPAKV